MTRFLRVVSILFASMLSAYPPMSVFARVACAPSVRSCESEVTRSSFAGPRGSGEFASSRVRDVANVISVASTRQRAATQKKKAASSSKVTAKKASTSRKHDRAQSKSGATRRSTSKPAKASTSSGAATSRSATKAGSKPAASKKMPAQSPKRTAAAKAKAKASGSSRDVSATRASKPAAQTSRKAPARAAALKLAWPVTGRTIVQGYGERTNPTTKTVTVNPGVNIRAPYGSAVRAAAGGRVSLVSWLPGYGTFLIVEHRDGYRTVYANLARASVARGASVRTGQKVGVLKASSDAKRTATFLHFEVWQRQTRLNPSAFLR